MRFPLRGLGLAKLLQVLLHDFRCVWHRCWQTRGRSLARTARHTRMR